MSGRKDTVVRRPRMVLLWAIGAFVGLELTASLLLDYGWPLLRFPSARQTMGRLAYEAVNPEIVSLGSSRFQSGIVPEEISSLLTRQCRTEHPVRVFNASVPFGDVIAAEYVLDLLVRTGVRPKLIVLEVSPEQLNSCNDWVGIHSRRQLRWHEAPGYFLEVCRSKQFARWFGERVNPLYYHREELWSEAAEALQRKPVVKNDGNTAAAMAGTDSGPAPVWDELLRPLSGAVTTDQLEVSRKGVLCVQSWLTHFRITGSRALAMQRILARCRDMGVEVVMVQPPVSLLQREIYTPEIDKQFLAYIGSLTQSYGCRFVDYRDRAPDNLFVDNHHLGMAGGVFFSRLLTYEVLAPFWQARLGKQDTRVAAARH